MEPSDNENTAIFRPNVDYLRTEKKKALESLEGLTIEQANEVVGFLYQTISRPIGSDHSMEYMANASMPANQKKIIIGKQI